MDIHVTRKWYHLFRMIDFGQREIIGEKSIVANIMTISSCVRNYEYLIGDLNVDTAESIPTEKKS